MLRISEPWRENGGNDVVVVVVEVVRKDFLDEDEEEDKRATLSPDSRRAIHVACQVKRKGCFLTPMFRSDYP